MLPISYFIDPRPPCGALKGNKWRNLSDRRAISRWPRDGECAACGTRSPGVQVWVRTSSSGLPAAAPTLGPAFLPFHDEGLAPGTRFPTWLWVRAKFVSLKPQVGEKEMAVWEGFLGRGGGKGFTGRGQSLVTRVEATR